jgi:glucose/arabinose dehydrogenase
MGAVYVATERQVIRLEDTDKDGVADKREVMIDDFPIGGNHLTRTIVFGPDGMMYVSMGSECNACIDQDPRQAAVSRYTPDWKFDKVYAQGLRNAVGFVFHPITKEMWATNNGRDMLGDDIPPKLSIM